MMITKTLTGMRKDAADEQWITINGAHVLLGEGGDLKGHLGNKIEANEKNSGKTGSGERRQTANHVNTHNPNRNYGGFNVSYVGHGSTLEKYVKNGKLSPERQALHKKIIDSLLDGIPKPKGQPTTTFLGGGPASGKSSVTKDKNVNFADASETVFLDSDKIKAMIPEYNDAVKNNDSNAANMAHAESSMIAWNALRIAQEEGYNCMMDGTGDGSAKAMLDSIHEAKAKGQQVIGVYVTCDTDTAVLRAEKRAASSGGDHGRKVPEIIIRNTHQNVSKILPKIAAEFDEVKLYSTEYGKPELVAQGGSGKKLTAIDDELYENFIRKQTESLPYHLSNARDYNVRQQYAY